MTKISSKANPYIPQFISISTSAFLYRSPCIEQRSIKPTFVANLYSFEVPFPQKANLPSLNMASASSMPSLGERQHLKSLLECSICLETFEEPRTLPCLHSFCKKCLENFVDGKRDSELNCPVCRCKFTLNKEGKKLL